MEIAESLQLSRNIVIALLVFQSWKPFMHQWARAVSRLSTSNKNISIPALEILKVHYLLCIYVPSKFLCSFFTFKVQIYI